MKPPALPGDASHVGACSHTWRPYPAAVRRAGRSRRVLLSGAMLPLAEACLRLDARALARAHTRGGRAPPRFWGPACRQAGFASGMCGWIGEPCGTAALGCAITANSIPRRSRGLQRLQQRNSAASGGLAGHGACSYLVPCFRLRKHVCALTRMPWRVLTHVAAIPRRGAAGLFGQAPGAMLPLVEACLRLGACRCR